MKKVISLLFVFAAVSAMAQPSGHFAKHPDVGRALFSNPKADFAWRMTGFHTDDNYQTCTFTYDAGQRLVAVRDSVRGEYSVVDSISYNADGNIVRLSGWQLLSGSYRNVYYVDYAYDGAGNIVSRSNYNNFDGDWVLGGIYNYTYNSANQLVLTTLTMGNTVYQKVEYSYGAYGCIEEIWYEYDYETSSLVKSEKFSTQYANGHKSIVYDSVCNDGTHWSYYGKYTYVYDNDGNCLEYHHFNESNREVERGEYTYDASKTLNHTLMPWNPEMNRPKTYDNVNVCVREAWYSMDVDYVLQYICDYIYDYAAMGSGVEPVVSSNISVAPNPATNVVSISSLTDENVQVQIVDAAGRVSTNAFVDAANSIVDISGLVSGIYVVRVIQHGIPQSIKLVVK